MKDDRYKLFSKFRRLYTSIVTPVFFAGASLFILGFFLFVINNNSKVEQSKDIHVLAERAVKNLISRLNGNLDFLKLIAVERANGNITEKTFHAHVTHFLKDHPEFINITWIDSNFVIRTVSPLQGNSHIIGLHIELPEPKRASRLAREKQEAIYTKPFEAIQANSSLEVWVPVFQNNKFIGLFSGVYSSQKLLEQIIPVDKQYSSFYRLIDENGDIVAEYPKMEFHKTDISYFRPLTSLANGLKISVNIVKIQPFSWILRLLTFLTIILIIGFSYTLWKIQTEINARRKIEEVLKKNEIELKKQNTEYLALNEELSEKNEELRIAKEKADESNSLKTAFLQNMSHEIRTPMNAIMGFSSLLGFNYNNKQKISQFSEIINQRCHDLLDIINDILDIAKIESGQLSINIEECNLRELFEELSSFFTEYKNRIGKQHIELNIQQQSNSEGSTVITDKIKLKQIFINLISNALKFTDEGKVEGGCKFDKNNNLVFYVSDTGIGIPLDKQSTIFERFVQLNQSPQKNIGGTGLGLPIVKGLVNLLGGEITLDSEPGKGSIFSFTITCKIVQSSNSQSLETDAQKPESISDKTVLIVEDDLYNAKYLKEVLSLIELNILVAENGEKAIEISKKQPIDLILMDIRLPGIDGYEAIRQIKALKPEIKIIAQTAYASSDEKLKAMHAGCIAFISKPTKRNILLSTVKKSLT